MLGALAGLAAAALQFAGALKSAPPLAALPFDITLLAALALLALLPLLLAGRRWEVTPGLAWPLLGCGALWCWWVVAAAWSPWSAGAADRLPEKFRRVLLRTRPIEIRPVQPRNWIEPEPGEPDQHVWFRLCAPIGDDPAVHRAVLAYASDMGLLGTGMIPHGVSWLNRDMQVASLDHALWFHRPFRADEWFLYDCWSPSASGARGLATGRMFTVDGRHIASAVQEGLLRRVGA